VSILGTRVIGTEDPRFLTIGGVYTADVSDERLAGACHVQFVRSMLAHARIRSVDVGAALRAPGVIAAFTAADLADLLEAAPDMGMINQKMGQPLLARDLVRYVGEPVTVVVTEDHYQGEDAADLVDVDYDPLPPVVAAAEAAGSGSPVLFPDAGTNVAASFGDAAKLKADVPSFELADSQTPTSYNPLGAKGIGKAGTIGSTPAVQNAIIDALAHLGVRHIDMPASPQGEWQVLRSAVTQ
jgi:CO/xanthine dehydrogenase Mo-binding subunit